MKQDILNEIEKIDNDITDLYKKQHELIKKVEEIEREEREEDLNKGFHFWMDGGGKYSKEGQPILLVICEGKLHFIDKVRKLDGTLSFDCDLFLENGNSYLEGIIRKEYIFSNKNHHSEKSELLQELVNQ